MSTPVSPRSTVPPTREQLDDLDALLERMLELPVNQLDEPALPTRGNGSVAAAPEENTATLSQLKASRSELAAVTTVSSPGGLKRQRVPRPTLRFPDLPRPVPSSSPIPPTAVPDDAPPANVGEGPTIKIVPSGGNPDSPAEIPPAVHNSGATSTSGSPVTGLEPAGTLSAVAASSRVRASGKSPSWWRLPLGWLNLCFDYSASRLGQPGRWARQRSGRKILGWVGVVLLGLALVLLILDWIGWPS